MCDIDLPLWMIHWPVHNSAKQSHGTATVTNAFVHYLNNFVLKYTPHKCDPSGTSATHSQSISTLYRVLEQLSEPGLRKE